MTDKNCDITIPPIPAGQTMSLSRRMAQIDFCNAIDRRLHLMRQAPANWLELERLWAANLSPDSAIPHILAGRQPKPADY